MIHPTLNHRIEHAAAVWRWQRVIRSLATVASIALLVVLAIGAAALKGWLATPTLLYALLALTLFSSGVAALVMIIHSFDHRLDRQWLAAAVESREPPLLDRLNAVLELEQRPSNVSAAMYRQAIERQAATVVQKLPDRSPFSWSTTLRHVAAAGLIALLTLWFYTHFEPLRLLADNASTSSGEVNEDGDLGLTIPKIDDTNSSELAGNESGEPWGQIRISEPGRDLRVTRYEDVPLLIEAAADRPLADVYWSSTINIENETRHDLPDPDDPRYAVFQPILRPDDLGLKEWDLVFYQAVALAGDDTQYESSTYFVEVIPSRDELDELPQAAYQQLQEMTELIEQQQEVIRQTNRLNDASAPQQGRRVEALADQENRIASSAERYQVALENRLGPQASATFTSSIEASRESLRKAEATLSEHNVSDAISPEHDALMRLADARRHLAELVKEHLAAFEPSAHEAIDDAQALAATPADPDFAKLLEQMHSRDEGLKAARELVQQTFGRQRSIERNASLDAKQKEKYQSLAEQQSHLEREFGEAIEKNPTGFEQAMGQCTAAQTGMQQAAQSLRASGSEAPQLANDAAQQLQELDDELEQQQRHQGISDKQIVRNMLEKMDKRLEEIAKKPDQVTSQQKQQTANQCKSAGGQACKLAGENPGPGAAGPGAGRPGDQGGTPSSRGESPQDQADSASREQQLEAASNRLAEAQGNEETASTARALQQQLRSLAAELGTGSPGGHQPGGKQSTSPQPGELAGQSASTQSRGETDALRSSGAEAIERGLAQIESAARRSQQGTLTPEANDSLRRGGVADVVAGIRSRYGYNENSQAVIAQLTDEIADPSLPVDLRSLQQLREEIQSLQQDLTIQSQDSGDAQPTLYVDPANLPPDYRDSIQEYFQKLSETR